MSAPPLWEKQAEAVEWIDSLPASVVHHGMGCVPDVHLSQPGA